MALNIVGSAQNRRGMNGGHHMICPGVLQRNAPLLRQTELAPEQCMRCGSTQANDYLWLDHFYFRLEPRLAGRDFARPRLLVKPPLSTLFELEMLHNVGYVGVRAVD